MLILAGVSLSSVFSERGIFNKAETAGEKHNEAKAREVLETVLLADGQYEKNINPNYNQDKFLDDLIKSEIQGSDVKGDVAIVGSWAFELDRSVPKIGRYLGNPNNLVFPTVSISEPVLTTNNTIASFTATAVEEKNGINKIELWLEGKIIETYTENYSNVKTKITKDFKVNKNGTYTVKVYGSLMTSEIAIVVGIIQPKPKTGDYVEYIPDEAPDYLIESIYSGYGANQTISQNRELKWRILNINEDGSFEIIADTPIEKNVYLKGGLGFNNGVLLLNRLCKAHYSNNKLNAIGRSINILDIEKRFTGEGIKVRNSSDNGLGIKYGTKGIFADAGRYLPDIYLNVSQDSTGETIEYYEEPTTKNYEETSGIQGTQTYYGVKMESNYLDNEEFFKIIFNTNTNYWVTSRCMYWYFDDTYRAQMCLRSIKKDSIAGDSLFFTHYGQRKLPTGKLC